MRKQHESPKSNKWLERMQQKVKLIEKPIQHQVRGRYARSAIHLRTPHLDQQLTILDILPHCPPQTLSTSATKHYDAFGNDTTSTGTWQGPFQYGGHFGYQTDPDSSLKLLGHRYYDASTGRFLSRDKAHDGRNWYTYAANNPIRFADPDGLQIVVVRGEDSGVPGSRVGFELDCPRGIGTHMFPRNGTKDQLMELLVEAQAFYFWGHGDENGALYLANGERLTIDDVKEINRRRKAKGKPKMSWIELRACHSCAKAEFVNAWLEISESVLGYPGKTGEKGQIGLDPRDWRLPRVCPPRVFREPIDYDPGKTGGKKKGDKKDKKYAAHIGGEMYAS